MTDSVVMEALGWALLHVVWQGMCIGALAALLLTGLRHSGPSARYAVCALTMSLFLGLPLLTLAGHLFWRSGADVGAGAVPTWLLPVQSRMPALLTAWTLGVCLMALRLALGLLWVQGLVRRAIAAPAEWQARLDTLALRAGLRRRVSLKLLHDLDSPLTLGSLRPVVLLPAAMLTGMPVQLLEALMAHELAHVRRWDYLVNLLQNLVEALMFFHPVVWWLSARMRAERELVADMLAAQAIGGTRPLALALHALSGVPRHPSARLALPARGGQLLKRIENLLTPAPTTPAWKLTLPAVLLAFASQLLQANGPAQGLPKPGGSGDLPIAQEGDLGSLALNAKHVAIVEEGSGRVLMHKDADAVVPIASLTKLMTALVVLDARLDPQEVLRISSDDVDRLLHTSSRLPVGAAVSRQHALQLALMASDNRAAAALARTYPGGQPAFLTAMQAKIHSLSLEHTLITEPTGLSASNRSTASEMAEITQAAGRYPEIEVLTRGQINGLSVSNTAESTLSRLDADSEPAPGDVLLAKTGYTRASGRCLTMRLKQDRKTYTVVLLDSATAEQRLQDAAQVRNWVAKLSLRPAPRG